MIPAEGWPALAAHQAVPSFLLRPHGESRISQKKTQHLNVLRWGQGDCSPLNTMGKTDSVCGRWIHNRVGQWELKANWEHFPAAPLLPSFNICLNSSIFSLAKSHGSEGCGQAVVIFHCYSSLLTPFSAPGWVLPLACLLELLPHGVQVLIQLDVVWAAAPAWPPAAAMGHSHLLCVVPTGCRGTSAPGHRAPPAPGWPWGLQGDATHFLSQLLLAQLLCSVLKPFFTAHS